MKIIFNSRHTDIILWSVDVFLTFLDQLQHLKKVIFGNVKYICLGIVKVFSEKVFLLIEVAKDAYR